LTFPFSNTHSLAEALDMSIYWGNGQDFSIVRQTYVPANKCQWATPADLDGDGATDLVVCNYSNGSTTDIDSYVYWGGPAGFQNTHRLGIPSAGVHNDAGVDIGDIKNRRFEFAYISSPHEAKGTPISIYLPPAKWIQYRAVLDTGNGASSPILKSVEIRFR